MKYAHLSLLFSFTMLSCAGMEQKDLLAKFPDIPAEEVVIYLQYATEARKHLADITGMVGKILLMTPFHKYVNINMING